MLALRIGLWTTNAIWCVMLRSCIFRNISITSILDENHRNIFEAFHLSRHQIHTQKWNYCCKVSFVINPSNIYLFIFYSYRYEHHIGEHFNTSASVDTRSHCYCVGVMWLVTYNYKNSWEYVNWQLEIWMNGSLRLSAVSMQFRRPVPKTFLCLSGEIIWLFLGISLIRVLWGTLMIIKNLLW